MNREQFFSEKYVFGRILDHRFQEFLHYPQLLDLNSLTTQHKFYIFRQELCQNER